MVRYGVPLILGCLYLAGSVWVVRNEGQAHRESLRQARLKAGAGAPPSSVRDAEAEPSRGAIPAEEPIPPRPESPPLETPTPAEAPEAARGPEVKSTPASDSASPNPAPPTPAPQPASPVPAPPTPAPGPAPAGPSTSAPAPQPASPVPAPPADAPPPPDERTAEIFRWKSDPFWSRAHLARKWDPDSVTAKDEKQLGEELNGLILQLNPEDRDGDLQRVKEAAGPLLEHLGRKDDYRFFILNSGVANAFSHAGGYVYVSRALLDMLPEDEPHLLEFVVGHEIAHIELHHTLACLRNPGVRKLSDGTLQTLYFLIIPHGYTDKLEYEADTWAYIRMKQLRRSEHDCLQFLRILDHYARSHAFKNGRGKPEELLQRKPGEPESAGGISPIDNHLRSHPAAYERLNRLKELGRRAARETR